MGPMDNPFIAFLAYMAQRDELEAMRAEHTEPLGDVPITGDPPHHAGHDCPNPQCNGVQALCREGRFNTQHSHVCKACGTKWQHGPGGH